MRGLMKLAGVARFDCIGSTQEFACYMAGLASPGDHTCGWTTSTLHSHLAWRYWFRWGCGASSTTSVIADLAGSHIPYPRSTGPDHAALHPFRTAAPDPSQCTRSEGVQCLRIGCTASHNKPNRGQLLPTDPNRPYRTQPHILKTRGNAAQRRLKRRLAIEKHTPATTPLTAALISCLDTATLPEPLEDSTGTLTPTGPMTDSIDRVRPSPSPRDTLEEAKETVGRADVSSEHTGGTTPSFCASEAIATSLAGTGTSAL